MKVFLVLLLVISCEVRRDYPEISKISWERVWERALEKASAEGKPVFIYFYAVWCSWCREYEEVLERKKVRELLEENFVPLLLDSDRDRALFLKFGGRGTPFTVILNKGGDPVVAFHGAVGEEDLLEILGLVIREKTGFTAVKEGVQLRDLGGKTYRRLLEGFLRDLEVRFDPVLGGFSSPSEGGALFKWPTPITYTFLLRKGLLEEEVLFSIDKDIEFLFDEFDGGFFNFYDRTRAFDFHFETSKSLRVNGEMILALTEAFRKTGEERYLRYALRTFRYLEKFLLHGGSGCYLNAQVSDPEYYNLPPEERRRRKPPPPDTAVIVEDNARTVVALLNLYRVTGEKSILRRAERCLEYMVDGLLLDSKIYRFYDTRTGKRGTPNFGRDVAFLSLALLESGKKEKALEVADLEAEHDWVSLSVLAYVLARSGEKNRAVEILRYVRVDPNYQNPDDMVFLLMALELLIERG
ncbi:MAG: thioredoxin family protein [Aquificota bacterium]|nr:thioredoxin family protein [Aquificota bacterium]